VAASAFEDLFRVHPEDRRAAIAALEAGRLRMRGDELKEARTDLAFAKSHAAEPFREDAHASEVECLARLGQRAACQAAREEFLGRYPQSPHLEKVASRCP